MRGEHSGEVCGQPSAGDVAQGVHLDGADEVQAVERVDARGLEQLLAERAAELVDVPPEVPAREVEEHPADEGVAVAVQAAGRHRDDDVPGPHAIGPEHLVGLDDAGARACHVVLLLAEQPRVLRCLAADQCAAGAQATLGDPLDDRRDPVRVHLAAGDVVGHEQRLGAAHDEVVDHHGDEVDADRVVHVHPLGDRDFRADAVGRGREQGTAHARERARVEQAGEAAEPADHLGPLRPGHPTLHQVDGAVPGLDVDAGCGVRRARGARHLGHCRLRPGRARDGQGRRSASAAPPPTPVSTPSASLGPTGNDDSISSSRCLPSS